MAAERAAGSLWPRRERLRQALSGQLGQELARSERLWRSPGQLLIRAFEKRGGANALPRTPPSLFEDWRRPMTSPNAPAAPQPVLMQERRAPDGRVRAHVWSLPLAQDWLEVLFRDLFENHWDKLIFGPMIE